MFSVFVFAVVKKLFGLRGNPLKAAGKSLRHKRFMCKSGLSLSAVRIFMIPQLVGYHH